MINYKAKEEKGKTFREISDERRDYASPNLSDSPAIVYKCAKGRADAEFNDTPIKKIAMRDIDSHLIWYDRRIQ